MGIECPKYHFDNPDDSKFCKECGTQVISSKEIPVTETLETPTEELTRGTTLLPQSDNVLFVQSKNVRFLKNRLRLSFQVFWKESLNATG
jgi:hypothetical protein